MLLVMLLLFAVAQSSRVQTAAVGVLLRQLETSLDAHAAVEKVDYKFPNRLLIHGVYIEDQLGDTLLYADTLQARFDMRALLFDDKVAFRKVDLAHVKAYAHPVYFETDSMGVDSCMNYQFLVDAFAAKEQKEQKPFPIRLEVKDVTLCDVHVQYTDWLLHLSESSLALNHLAADSIDAQVGSMAFMLRHCDKSISGGGECPADAPMFRLETFRGRLMLTPSRLYLPEVYVAAPHSRFHATEMSLQIGDSAFLNPSSPVSFRMEEARLSPSDLALFVPSLRSFKGYIDADARLTGRVDSLHASDLTLSYNDTRLLLGDVMAVGLPEVDSTDFNVECQDLFVNKALLQDLISNLQGKPFTLPKPVARLGDMHYRGKLTGRLHDLSLHGVFTSALGNITTNGRASVDSAYTSLAFTGEVATRRFALGKMLDAPDLGTASLAVHVDGMVADGGAFRGKLRAKIEQLRYRDYDYRNLCLDGTLRDNVFAGIFTSDDENLNLAFNGTVDFSSQTPAYDFLLRLNHLRLGRLNLSQKYADSDLSFVMRLQAKGKSLDTFTGELNIDSLLFVHAGKELPMRSLTLSALHNPHAATPDAIRLHSDYLNASFSGDYLLSTLPVTLQKFVMRYVPMAFSADNRRRIRAKRSSNHADFYFYFRDLATVSSVLDLPISLGDMPLIKGFIHEDTGQIGLRAIVPEYRAGEQFIENITLGLDNMSERLNLSLGALVHHTSNITSKHMGDLSLFLNTQALNDSLSLTFDWTNIDTIHNAGSLRLSTAFRQYAGKPLVSLRIYPTEFLLGDSLWNMEASHLTYSVADTALQVDHFMLHSSSQFIRATGIASTHAEDTIRVDLQRIDLDYLLGTLTDVHQSIYFGGNVTGWATAYGLFSRPMFEADVEMLHAKINGCEIGDIYATATLDDRNHVIIRGQCYETFPSSPSPLGEGRGEARQVVSVFGDIGGPNGEWDLRIRPDSVRIGFVNHWVKTVLQDMDGRASGEVHVWGGVRPGSLQPYTRVTVFAQAHNIGITLPYTGARYYVNDSVLMDTTSIVFRDMTIHDDYGNPLQLDGGLYHDGDFRDLSFHFDIQANKALVLNLPETPDQLYSGKIFATGDVTIDGTETTCRVDATAITDAGSNVTIMATGASTASSSDFIHFLDQPSPSPLGEGRGEAPSKPLSTSLHPSSPFSTSLNLSVEVTPSALVRVVIDPRTGDQIKGYGEGNLRLSYTSTGSSDNVTMFGGYTLQQGTFSFTLQNVIRREFEIASGSTVTWQGDPMEPVLDARAIYHLTASLRDLFGSEMDQINTNRTSVPVNCLLNLSGVLTTPVIRFGITLPSSDESVASQVRSVINTEDMLTRQVLYLLVFNRFYTPDYLQNRKNIGLTETFSVLSSTVTGQINNWLGKITNMFTLGFNIRADGFDSESSQEYEAQFEIQPVRGLLINGNFGYRYNDISNHPIFGNLDVEYMLTRDGKLRAKAYTHTVDKYSLRQANTIQGLGLVFKHDFNWPSSRTASKAKEQNPSPPTHEEPKGVSSSPTHEEPKGVSTDTINSSPTVGEVPVRAEEYETEAKTDSLVIF